MRPPSSRLLRQLTLLIPLVLAGLLIWRASQTERLPVESPSDRVATGSAEVNEADSIDAIGAFADWLSVPIADRAPDLSDVVRLAAVRRIQMKELIRRDPEAALAVAVPYAARQSLPAEVVELLETPVSTSADLDVSLACGGPDGRSILSRRVWLEGTEREVFAFGNRVHVQSKNRLSLHGIAIDEVMALDDSPVRILDEAEKQDRTLAGLVFQAGHRLYRADSEEVVEKVSSELVASETTLDPDFLPAYRGLAMGEMEGVEFLAMQDGAPGDDSDLPPEIFSPRTEGAKTMLYIRARFANEGPTSEPVALATVQTEQAKSEAYWAENSYGKGSLATTFTDVVTLPMDGPDYVGNFGGLRNDAAAAALALNSAWNRDNFDFYTIVTNNAGFPYAGVAQLNNKGSHLIKNYISVRTAAHEYGHNLGLNHSAYWRTDSPSPIGADSAPGGYVGDSPDNERIEYGHKFCVMGAQNGSGDFNEGRAHFTAGNKNRLDWLNTADGDIATTTTSGTFRLYRHDVKQADFGSMTAGVARAIKIDLPATDPTAFGNPYKYWLNYRLLPTNGIAEQWLPHGIQVDWRRDGNGFRSVQLDMTPYTRNSTSTNASTNTDNSDKEDGVLVIGRTFSDVGADIHFTATAKGGANPNEYLDVVVNVGTQGSNTPPEIQTLTASSTQVAVNEQVTFTVTASDSDGDTLVYYWDNDDNSIQPNQLNQSTQTKGWGSAGFYVVQAEVSDMKGGKDVQSVVIQVGNPSDTGQIHGRVLQSGQPVEGAFVTSGSSYQTWTESDGTYVLAGLPVGTLALNADALGLTLTPQFANPVLVGDLPGYGFDFHADQPAAGGPALTLSVSPFEVEVPLGASVRFEASGWDNTGSPVAVSPSWSTTGGGVIAPSGVFSSNAAGGPFTITAQVGGTTATASVTVIEEDAVGVVFTDYNAAEAGDTGSFEIRRYGSTSGTLTVDYTMTGSATNGSDYVSLPGSVTFADGEDTVALVVTPINDFETEPTEFVVLQLDGGAGYQVYSSEGKATVALADDGDVSPTAAILSPTTDTVFVSTGSAVALLGGGTDDGQPQALGGFWSVVGSTPGVSIFPTDHPSALARFSQSGLYRLRYTATDGANEDSREITVIAGLDGTTLPAGDGIVIRYTFEPPAGDPTSATVEDLAGANHPGTLAGNAARTTGGGGIIGNEAVVFDGNADYVSIENATQINSSPHGLRTIAFWFKADSPGTSSAEVLYEEGGASRGLNLYIENSRIYFGGWNNNENGWNQTFLSAPLTDSDWHHAALVLDADGVTTAEPTAMSGYLDGLLVSQGLGAILNGHTGAIAIGGRRGDTRFHTGNSSGNGSYFAGCVDDFRLWNRALSQTEVAQLATQPDPPPSFTLNGVVAGSRRIVLPSGVQLWLDGVVANGAGAAWQSRRSPPTGTATFASPTPSTVVTFDQAGSYELFLRASSATADIGLPLSVYAGMDTPMAPSGTNAVLHYPLNEGSGTTAGDVAGTAQNGTLTNGPEWDSGILGGGLKLDGMDDVVAIDNQTAINTRGTHNLKSISLWFRANPTGTGNKEVLYEQGGGTRGLNLYLDGDTLYAGGWNGNLNGWASTHLPVGVGRDEWNHAVLLLDVPSGGALVPQGLRLWLNGMLVATGEAAEMASHTGNVGLGAMRATTVFHDGTVGGDGLSFAGIIDEFRYFDGRLLTEQEIVGLYAARNIAALVNAGPDQPDVQSMEVTLAGGFTDDGGAGTPSPLWSVLEGPDGGNAVFDQPDGSAVPTRATFSEEGYHRLRLSVFDGEVTTVDDMQLSTSDGPSFGGWIGGYFDLDAGERVPGSNSDTDPFDQFYEYATGGNPMADDDPSVLLPSTAMEDDNGSDFFEFKYRRRRDYAARNLVYEVQFSDTLASDNWDSAEGAIVAVDPIDANFEHVTVRFNQAIGGVNTHRFARLSIRQEVPGQ